MHLISWVPSTVFIFVLTPPRASESPPLPEAPCPPLAFCWESRAPHLIYLDQVQTQAGPTHMFNVTTQVPEPQFPTSIGLHLPTRVGHPLSGSLCWGLEGPRDGESPHPHPTDTYPSPELFTNHPYRDSGGDQSLIPLRVQERKIDCRANDRRRRNHDLDLRQLRF